MSRMKRSIQTVIAAAGMLAPLLAVEASTANLRGIASGAGAIVAVNSHGRIVTSTRDGEWTERESRTPFALHSIIFAKGQFVAIGNEGAIVTSSNGLDWTP